MGRRTKDCKDGEHVLMLASNTQLVVLCQKPKCSYEGMYVGDPLTTADVTRLTGTKAAANGSYVDTSTTETEA